MHSEFITNKEAAGERKPWGIVLSATLLVNFATVTGLLLLLVPTVRMGLLGKTQSGTTQHHGKLLDIVIPSFAVGALLATAIFLVLPEAMHLTSGVHLETGREYHSDNEEGIAAAKLGCGFLGGFFLPMLFSIFFHHEEVEKEDNAALLDEEECKSCEERDAKFGGDGIGNTAITGLHDVVLVDSNSGSNYDADEEIPVGNHEGNFREESSLEPITAKTKIVYNYGLAASILIGDAFCNFADGIFIGAAFLGCSWATAFSITAVSLLHELPQELADFVILTRYVGLSVTKACILNFVTGLSVCLGGIIVLAAKPSDEAVGIVLAIAGGVYVNIAACETFPRVEQAIKGRCDRALTFLMIIVGTIPIGLVLLKHEHC